MDPSSGAGERATRLRARFPERAEALLALAERSPDPVLAAAGAERFADAAGPWHGLQGYEVRSKKSTCWS